MRVRLPYPHAGQQRVLREAKRFNVLSAGRRWRKTTLMLQVALLAALQGRERVIWGAPTYDQVRVGWREAKRAMGGAGKFNESRMTLTLPGGGVIVYRSLDDPDNARGHTANGVIIDEAGDVKPEAWAEVLRPMLIDTNGWAWLIGTPKGRNWFWKEWAAAQSRDDSAAWQIPTLGVAITDGGLKRQPHPYENPNIPFSEIEQLYRTLPERVFRQEVLAEFIEGEGAVFRNIAANLYKPNGNIHKAHRVVMGADWAKQNDYTALSVFCADCRAEIAHDRFNKLDYAFQRQRLEALYNRYHVDLVLAESNSIGEPVIEELRRSGLNVEGFQTTAASKPPLIESLALALEKQEARWIDNPVWTAELEAYEMTTSRATGRPTYSAPSGLHDDTVIARALAWRAATMPQAVTLSAVRRSVF